VAGDVLDGLVSAEDAQAIYGVVVLPDRTASR
jgi:hypothetical protein